MRGAELYTYASRRNKGGGSRLPHKRREAWRHGPFTEWGRGMVFKASTPHDHGVGRGRLTRRLGPARLPRGSHALGVATGKGGKPGRRGLGQRVGPSSRRLLRLDWRSGAAEPPPRSFIKSRRGDGVPHSFISSFLQLLPPFHPLWREGTLVLQRWRRGSLLDNAYLLLPHLRWQSQPRGEEEDGARPRHSGKRRTGRRAGLASASGSSSHGGP